MITRRRRVAFDVRQAVGVSVGELVEGAGRGCWGFRRFLEQEIDQFVVFDCVILFHCCFHEVPRGSVGAFVSLIHVEFVVDAPQRQVADVVVHLALVKPDNAAMREELVALILRKPIYL
ncbi:family transcriptional regulator, putative [Babesia ovata]|uniref:Family transcriptional regulator, putative n=1 Tax=Babesia ovata TaxID=189622 RepID=A0A2H6KCZ4_9APIC|nr:family transcriptional regulator, putative [Babesia ovata]GBE60862.1 family transcriptional regulator, putative [Babesia ovata]